MGWANCGDDDLGRPIGYAHGATCDAPGCSAEIDRGLSYVCGNMHGGDTYGCGRYFCTPHMTVCEMSDGSYNQLCAGCYAIAEAENCLSAEHYAEKALEVEEAGE